ncbi:hypothetical protein [Variovorax sp. WS11]|uniref:hypothetical protein n=1 Tax=Variovorax sp. WS11 TaxID=1105204 RepID=UPI0015E70E7C|nr:hypothetical protein [Variovorax sp. WS11]
MDAAQALHLRGAGFEPANAEVQAKPSPPVWSALREARFLGLSLSWARLAAAIHRGRQGER